PKLTGTSRTVYTGTNAARTASTAVNVAVTPPTFGCSSLTYDLYRSTSATNLGATAYKTNIGATYTETNVQVVGKFGTPDPYYYRYKITYTADGSTAAGSQVIWSNIIGPTTATNDVLTTMPFVSW
ncbi:MAG: hypothetical protein Q7V14_00350, partial [Coriobacteriia bacterium]|nr:hypothetical protein [Coriobacteriia bacterium]